MYVCGCMHIDKLMNNNKFLYIYVVNQQNRNGAFVCMCVIFLFESSFNKLPYLNLNLSIILFR